MSVKIDRSIALICSAVANMRHRDDGLIDDCDVIIHETEAIGERVDEYSDQIKNLNDKITDQAGQISELEEESGGFVVPDAGGDNLETLERAIVSKNFHDQLKLKALANLFRNCSLDDIEGLDKVMRHKYKLTKQPYLVY